MYRIKRRKSNLKRAAQYLALLPFLVFAFFPFYWMVITSLKYNQELYNLASNPFTITTGITFEHYIYLFKKTEFLVWFKNTFIVALVPTFIALVFSIPAGYALARLKFRWSALISTGIFTLYLMPPTLLFLPLSKFVNNLGLTNHLGSLIITFPTFMIPYCILMLSSYFRTIPAEIEDMALIDGCTHVQMLYKIVLPISKPGVITSSFFSFILAWDNLIYPVTFISNSSRKTISSGVLTELIRGDVYFWGSLMAGAVVSSIPIIVAFVFLMDNYVKGLTAGSIK
ncbi:MAG: carbohydrate ABC transporter permease [Bacilli bacterium]